MSKLQQQSIQYVYVGTGVSVVTLNATVNGAPLVATKAFDVRRNPKAAIFYVTGPGDDQTTDPGDNRDNQLGEHVWWHNGVQNVAPAGEFLRFHRGFIQKFNCWRAIFGYPAVQTYVTAPGYVPAGPEVNHTGSPGTGTGVVIRERDTNRQGLIETLPDRLTLTGDGSTALANFSDENALVSSGGGSSLLSYHNRQHSRICARGDFTIPQRTPADPIFWRFHWMLTQVFEAWQFLKLDGGAITVAADSTLGATVFFPERAMRIYPTAVEGSAQNCFPASGSFFFIGTTTVNCTVSDVTLLDPASPDFGGTTKNVQFNVVVTPPPLPTGAPLDVYIIVDLSGSFTDDLPNFKAAAPAMIASIVAMNPDTRFGLGSFQDYPILPFGSAVAGDKAYERVLDLTFDTALVNARISGLSTRDALDLPQSQLAALFQAATGIGQDLGPQGFPSASIPSGQQASFRTGARKVFLLWTDAAFHLPGDPGTIPYPGPSFAATVAAILAVDPPSVIGIASDPAAVPDLEAMAIATGARAPAGGVDCNGDGLTDLSAGAPFVCRTAPTGVGIGGVIVAAARGALQSPIANAGAFRVLEATSPAGASVELDATASMDPQGASLTFAWSGAFGTAAGARPTVTLPLGHNRITLTATDPAGNTGTDTVLIIVRDTTPPELRDITVAPECLWPPNHKLVPYEQGKNLFADAVDAVDPDPQVRVIGAASNEPADGIGDGDTFPDIFFDSRRFCLRSERSGGGAGRVYTVTLEAVDASGNTSQATITVGVGVAHDQRGRNCPALPADKFVEDGDPRCGSSSSSEVSVLAGCSAAPRSASPVETGQWLAWTVAAVLGMLRRRCVRRRTGPPLPRLAARPCRSCPW